MVPLSSACRPAPSCGGAGPSRAESITVREAPVDLARDARRSRGQSGRLGATHGRRRQRARQPPSRVSSATRRVHRGSQRGRSALRAARSVACWCYSTRRMCKSAKHGVITAHRRDRCAPHADRHALQRARCRWRDCHATSSSSQVDSAAVQLTSATLSRPLRPKPRRLPCISPIRHGPRYRSLLNFTTARACTRRRT